jgi:hypothetical protein
MARPHPKLPLCFFTQALLSEQTRNPLAYEQEIYHNNGCLRRCFLVDERLDDFHSTPVQSRHLPLAHHRRSYPRQSREPHLRCFRAKGNCIARPAMGLGGQRWPMAFSQLQIFAPSRASWRGLVARRERLRRKAWFPPFSQPRRWRQISYRTAPTKSAWP